GGPVPPGRDGLGDGGCWPGPACRRRHRRGQRTVRSVRAGADRLLRAAMVCLGAVVRESEVSEWRAARAVDRKLPVSHAFGLSFRIAGCTDGRTTDVPGRGVRGPPGARGPGHAFPARATDPA